MVSKQIPLGVERLSLTVAELLATVDRDGDGKLSYVEFGTSIYYSPKHSPDKFSKYDKNSDGGLDQTELSSILSQVSWWVLSRHSAKEWMAKADKNKDDLLDIKEFSVICNSGHIDNAFKKADQDKSGSLSAEETTAYVHGVTHGGGTDEKSKRRRKKK